MSLNLSPPPSAATCASGRGVVPAASDDLVSTQSNSHSATAARLSLAAQIALPAHSISKRAVNDDAPGLQTQLVQELNAAFPDIRLAARRAIEARIASQYNIILDADKSYYNWFSTSAAPVAVRTADGWQGHPTLSQSLTEMQLATAWMPPSRPRPNGNPINGGIFRDGAWATRFDAHNRIPITAEQARNATLDTHFHERYAGQMRHWWNDNFQTLQTLSELQVLDYMETHRRAGNRAQALGIDPALNLSDEALGMIADATGRRDPDLVPSGVKTYKFNINGYHSQKMIWLESDAGRVVLVMPDDPRPLREFKNLGELQNFIRETARTAAGRDSIARYFSDADRRSGSSYWGIDRWLSEFGNGYDNTERNYDYVITDHYRQRADLGNSIIGRPDASGRSLLSDKALAMVSEAAGYPEPGRTALGTRAHFLDIKGIAARDAVWLQAGDGHVVLLMPHDPQPVREYASADAMRDALAVILRSEQGRQRLARHFSAADRHSTASWQGVDYWLELIGNKRTQIRQAIAHDPVKNALSGNVFQRQLAGQRDQELGLLDQLAAGHLPAGQSREETEAQLYAGNRFFNTMRRTDGVCDREVTQDSASAGDNAPTRVRRAPGDDPVDRCERTGAGLRPLRWGRALAQRLQAGIDRLRPAPPLRVASPGSASVADAASGLAASGSHARPRALENDYSTLPVSLPQGVTPNTRGFIENCHLQRLYRVEMVPLPGAYTADLYRPAADPLVAGFRADPYFSAGTRTLDGDIIDSYLTPAAAWQAFRLRHNSVANEGQVEFRLYEIAGDGLTAVSLGENETRNPRFSELMVQHSHWDRQTYTWGGVYSISFNQSRYRNLQNAIVQVRLTEDGLRSRTRLRETRVPDEFGLIGRTVR